MANVQALEFGVQNKTAPNKPTNLFLSNVNKENGAMDVYQLPLGPRGPRTLVMTSGSSNGWKPILTEEGKKLTPEYQKFLLTDVSKEADNQRAAYINKNFTKEQKETIFKGAPKVNNLAAPSEAEAAAQQGQTKPITQDEIRKDDNVQDGGVRLSYKKSDNLRYPIDREVTQDYIKFTMYRYEPRKVASASAGGNDEFGDRGSRNILGSASLPIQPSISDSNTVGWGDDKFNSIQKEFANLSIATMLGGAEGATEAAGQMAETATSNASDIKTQVVTGLAAAAVGTNARLFTRVSGAIVNPNLELLFDGPSLRTFAFNFSLSARSKEEAVVIKEIIRFFKQGMSVKRAKSSLYLKSPNTFGISYVYGQDGQNKDHPWLNRIKECALTSCNVQYTPAGNYATYEDGSMVQYDITLNFSELDPIYDDDYTKLPGGDNDTEIGY